MTLPTSFIEDLRGRVADVSTDPDELARTAKDWSWPAKFAEQEGRPALPAAVVRARSTRTSPPPCASPRPPACRSSRAAAAPA